MSLKEKAKRVDEWYSELMPIEGSDSEGDFRRSSNVLLVRLEEAQKEIDLANKAFKEQYKEAERLSNLLRNAENEHLILKQKLQQFAIFLDDFYKRRRNQIVRPKFYEIFGEFLKVEREAK